MEYDYFATPGSVPADRVPAERVSQRPAFAGPPPAPAPPPAAAPASEAVAQPAQWAPPPPGAAPVEVGSPYSYPPTSPTITPQEQAMLASSAATSYQQMTGTPAYYPPGTRIGFWGSIRVGFQLLPVCWSVLAQELVLLVVPIAVLTLGALALFGYSEAFGGINGLLAGNKVVTAAKVFPILAFLMVLSSVGQGVIVAAATDILEGHKSSFGTAWLAALNQLPRLAWFGVVYAGERTLTGLLRSRRSWSPTTLAANAIDRAWDFATFLAIPVLLYENVTVFQAVVRSGKLVMQRWGVQLTARSVLGLALFVVSLPFLLLAVLVAAKVSVAVGVALVILVLLAQIALSGALTGVLAAALYRFAVSGLVAPGFRDADMWAVFARR